MNGSSGDERPVRHGTSSDLSVYGFKSRVVGSPVWVMWV